MEYVDIIKMIQGSGEKESLSFEHEIPENLEQSTEAFLENFSIDGSEELLNPYMREIRDDELEIIDKVANDNTNIKVENDLSDDELTMEKDSYQTVNDILAKYKSLMQ
jgi:hypothetical protein